MKLQTGRVVSDGRLHFGTPGTETDPTIGSMDTLPFPKGDCHIIRVLQSEQGMDLTTAVILSTSAPKEALAQADRSYRSWMAGKLGIRKDFGFSTQVGFYALYASEPPQVSEQERAQLRDGEMAEGRLQGHYFVSHDNEQMPTLLLENGRGYLIILDDSPTGFTGIPEDKIRDPRFTRCPELSPGTNGPDISL